MDWGILLEPLVVPQLLAVTAMWALAAGLLYLDFNHPAHRVFALLLGLRGLSMLAALLRDLYTGHPSYLDPQAATYWANVFPYFVIPLPFLVIRFASIYPRRRGWFAGRPGVMILTLAGLTAEVVYLFAHGTWTATDRVFSAAADRIVTLHMSTGPLAAFLGAMWLLFGLLVLRFAYDHVRMQPGPRRRALLIVLTGFALNTVYEAVASWMTWFEGIPTGTSALVQWQTRLALVPVLLALVLLWRQYGRTVEPTERLPLTRLFLVIPFPALSAIAVISMLPELGVEPIVSLLVVGFWRLTLPFLVTYALLRFQLFDLDLKVKFALRQTTLASIFVFILLVLSEVLEGYVTDGLDNAIAIVVAVGLTYLVTPVQRFAERVSDRLMPHTKDTPEFRQGRRIDVYRATLERSIEDGVLTANEMRILAHLRDELGLTTADVEELETKVAQQAGLDTLPGPAVGKPTANPK